MPAPTTSDEYLELIRKSGVVDANRLQSYVDRLRETGKFPNAIDDLVRHLIEDGVITFFQAEQFRAGRWRRFTIGKYKVLEKLGAGGMGTVYLCEHMLMKRRVAVKVLPPAKVNDSSALERFYREATAVASLDHPNIVRAYDIDEDDKLHFLVLELVDGSSLQEIIKKTGPMDYTRVAHYMRQSAMGLQHAHDVAALVHRDIKPGNILVDRYGVVKILDMGLARFFHDETDDLTKRFDENVLGTADYLAPEQALDSHGADIRADLYSLGGTFYFCLTGRPPFTDGTVAQKLIWHQTRQPKPIRSFRQDVPEGLIAIIDKLMAKDKNERYQSPQEVADALEEWTQTPIAPPPEEEMPQFSIAARSTAPPSEAGMSSARAESDTVPARRPWQTSHPSGSGTRPAVGSPTPPPSSSRPLSSSTKPPPSSSSRPPSSSSRPQSSSRQPSSSSTPARGAADTRANGVPPAAPAPAPAAPPPAKQPVGDVQPKPDRLQDIGRRFFDLKNHPQRVRIACIAGAVGVVFLALLIWMFTGRGGKQGTSEAEPILVGDAPGHTLAAALRKAKDGDRILIKGNITEANLTVNKAKLVIEADKGVVWKCPANVPPNTKLLIVENAPEFQLRDVILDGDNQADFLVVMYGKCPGATFDKVEFRGMRRYAVHVTNCEGSAEAPVLFSQCSFETKPSQTGIYFDFNPTVSTVKLNGHFRLKGCTFAGSGKKVGARNPNFVEKGTLEMPSDLTLEIGP